MLKQALNSGIIPRTANGLKTGFKACFYKMAELSSGTLADTFGNGPNFTGQGSLTTDATGGITPATPNSTKYATAAANAYLLDLWKMSGTFGEVIFAFDYINTLSNLVATNQIFTAGRQSASIDAGVVYFQITTAEKLLIGARGSVAGGSAFTFTNTASTPFQTTSRVTALVSIRLNSAIEAAVDMHFRTGLTTYSSSGTLAIDSGVGAPGYGNGTDDGYTMFANKTGASTYASYLNGGAAEAATIRNMLMLKTPTYDPSLALSILLDMSNNPGEIPRRILEGSA